MYKIQYIYYNIYFCMKHLLEIFLIIELKLQSWGRCCVSWVMDLWLANR